MNVSFTASSREMMFFMVSCLTLEFCSVMFHCKGTTVVYHKFIGYVSIIIEFKTFEILRYFGFDNG